MRLLWGKTNVKKSIFSQTFAHALPTYDRKNERATCAAGPHMKKAIHQESPTAVYAFPIQNQLSRSNYYVGMIPSQNHPSRRMPKVSLSHYPVQADPTVSMMDMYPKISPLLSASDRIPGSLPSQQVIGYCCIPPG